MSSVIQKPPLLFIKDKKAFVGETFFTFYPKRKKINSIILLVENVCRYLDIPFYYLFCYKPDHRVAADEIVPLRPKILKFHDMYAENC